MASQIQITIFNVNGATQTSNQSISFPIDNILISETNQFGASSYVLFGTQKYYTTSTIDELSTTGLVEATVLRVDSSPLSSSVKMLFPANNISIQNSILSNALVVYNGTNYYVDETEDDLITAANAGGSGGPTIYTGDGSLEGDRTVDLNGHQLDFRNGKLGIFDNNTVMNFNGDSGSEGITLIAGDGVGGATMELDSNVGDGYLFIMSATDGINPAVNITGDGAAQTITITETNGVIIPSLAGGGTTGLSIDDTGKIIRTP